MYHWAIDRVINRQDGHFGLMGKQPIEQQITQTKKCLAITILTSNG